MVKDRLFIKLLEDVYYPKIFALKCQQTTFFFPPKGMIGGAAVAKKTGSFTKRKLFQSSIHLRLLFMGWVTLAAGSEGYSGSPSPSQHFPAPPGGSGGVPRPDEIYNPSSGFWVCPRVSSQLAVPRKHPKGGAKEAS